MSGLHSTTSQLGSGLQVPGAERIPVLALDPGLCSAFRSLTSMAPRANWRGFLRLSLVTCPVALYPATSDSDKISFNQINKKTGHRIKYAKVDADTGEEVRNEDIMKGFKVDTDTYIEVTKEELENVALESTRTIEINEFVPRQDIDPRYLIRPYYLRPDGKVGHDAGDPRNHPQHEQGCDRHGRSDKPRTHHRDRTA